MSKLETLKKGIFIKEITNEEMKSVKGAKIAAVDTGTRCEATNNSAMDCSDDSNPS
jgi:hypothetical protein